jgi:hypothetical protein
MAARLGNVIYWLGWIIAIPSGLCAAGLWFFWFMEPSNPEVPDLTIRQAQALKNWVLSWAFIGAFTPLSRYLSGCALSRHH